MNIVPQFKRRIYKDPDRMVKHLKYLKKKEQLMRERIQEQEETTVKEKEEKNDIQQINLDVSNFKPVIKNVGKLGWEQTGTH